LVKVPESTEHFRRYLFGVRVRKHEALDTSRQQERQF